MSQIKVNSIVPAGGLAGDGGGIIQTVYNFSNTTDSTNSTTYVDVSGMSATITPQSSSSKILVVFVVGNAGSSTSGRPHIYQILRGATPIGLGQNLYGGQSTFTGATGETTYMNGGWSYTILDTPATTSATTYKLQWKTFSNTAYINRGGSTSTGSWNSTGGSGIILMEVSG